MNVLCINDENHQRRAIEVCHSSKFKDIYSMVNQLLMGYDTENGATLQELPEKSPVLGKRKKKFLLKIERKQGKKLKPSVQSGQAEPEQYK